MYRIDRIPRTSTLSADKADKSYLLFLFACLLFTGMVLASWLFDHLLFDSLLISVT